MSSIWYNKFDKDSGDIVVVPETPTTTFTYTKHNQTYVYKGQEYDVKELHQKVNFIFKSLPEEIQRKYEEGQVFKKLAK